MEIGEDEKADTSVVDDGVLRGGLPKYLYVRVAAEVL